MERHERGEAKVIPIILRPVYWQGAPFGKIQALPTDGKPVTTWSNVDQALYNVTEGIRTVVEQLNPKPSTPSGVPLSQASIRESEATSYATLTPPTAKSLLSLEPEAISLLRTLERSGGFVKSVVFSPNGQVLASGSSDRTIRLWNPSTGELLRSFPGLPDVVISMAFFSVDGRLLASAHFDKAIRLWNLHTGELLHTLTGHSRAVDSVAISPDRQALASGSRDWTVKLWDLQTGKLLRSFLGHSDEVRSVAINTDGWILASGSSGLNDHTIRLWNLHTGELLCTITQDVDLVYCLAFSPDGKILVSGGSDESIKIWGKK